MLKAHSYVDCFLSGRTKYNKGKFITDVLPINTQTCIELCGDVLNVPSIPIILHSLTLWIINGEANPYIGLLSIDAINNNNLFPSYVKHLSNETMLFELILDKFWT